MQQAQEVQDRPPNPRAKKSPAAGRAGRQTSPASARALQDRYSRTRWVVATRWVSITISAGRPFLVPRDPAPLEPNLGRAQGVSVSLLRSTRP